jgi:hypothetical protein
MRLDGETGFRFEHFQLKFILQIKCESMEGAKPDFKLLDLGDLRG